MQVQLLLRQYKKRFDPFLRKYFQEKTTNATSIDPLAAEAVKMIADFALADGKRIRPAVMYYAHLATGGQDSDAIIRASISIELAHTFLLIHDDIIDRDEKRHGVPTLHERYRRIGKRLSPQKDTLHFGNSMAMIAGDMAASMANEVLYNIDFPPEVVLKTLDVLQRIVYVTIPGEMLDVVMEMRGSATESDILRMHEGKTARYTFEGPMHLGAALAQADPDVLRKFSSFALPIGIAFQIRDDILGVFGNEEKLGKPVGSDLIEGKQTLLVLKAMEKGTKTQKKMIREYLGNPTLTRKQIDDIRTILEETGSLAYSQSLARSYVAKSLEALEKIPITHCEAHDFFQGIAQYVADRVT